MVPLSWPGVKPRREKPMFMHTWVAGKLALFMTLMFIVHADRLQEGVRLAQEREDDAERKNDIKGGFLRPYFVQLRPHYR